MARLFRNGVPCDADVIKHKGVCGVFGMSAHHLELTSLSNVVIVDGGLAWRVLRKRFHSQGHNIILECTQLRLNAETQELILADMILS